MQHTAAHTALCRHVCQVIEETFTEFFRATYCTLDLDVKPCINASHHSFIQREPVCRRSSARSKEFSSKRNTGTFSEVVIYKPSTSLGFSKKAFSVGEISRFHQHVQRGSQHNMIIYSVYLSQRSAIGMQSLLPRGSPSRASASHRATLLIFFHFVCSICWLFGLSDY